MVVGLCGGRGLASHGFAIEIEHVKNLILRGRLVDVDLSDVRQQGEIDGVARVFLVVGHQFVQLVILFAVESEYAVVFFDEAYGLEHGIVGKSEPLAAQIQFADKSPGHGVSVEHRMLALQRQAFYGMPGRVTEIEGLSNASLFRVFADDVLFDIDALFDQMMKDVEVGGLQVVVHELCPNRYCCHPKSAGNRWR